MELSEVNIIRFEVEGYLGLFRDRRTTTSRISHIIPNKTQVIGMLLAKLGYGKAGDIDDLFVDSKELGYHHRYNRFLSIEYAVKFSATTLKKFSDYVNFRQKDIYELFRLINLNYIVEPKYDLILFIPKSLDVFSNENDMQHLLDKKYEFFKIYLGTNECPAYISDIEQLNNEKVIKIKVDKEKENIETSFAFPKSALGEEGIYNNDQNEDQKLIVEEVEDYSINAPKPFKEVVIPINSKFSISLSKGAEYFEYNGEKFVVL